MYVKDYKRRKASLPGPPQRSPFSSGSSSARVLRAHECVYVSGCLQLAAMLWLWSAKREQSADVFEELGEKEEEEEEEEEEKKKVFVHGLWSSPRRWCALDGIMFGSNLRECRVELKINMSIPGARRMLMVGVPRAEENHCILVQVFMNSPSASHCELRVGPAGGVRFSKKGEEKG